MWKVERFDISEVGQANSPTERVLEVNLKKKSISSITIVVYHFWCGYWLGNSIRQV
jgi:hypothetical protein